jgi:predicted transposase/invertase (TIGR01784 family)
MVGSHPKIVGQHDLSYRLFFSHRRMIQDLLREIVGERWVERIDFNSGVLVNGSFVSPEHQNRESDVIWQFRRLDGGEPVFVYILMEFQSRPDPSMPVRLMGYVGLFYQNLMKNQPAAGWKKLPLVIPVVVYNGPEPWNVATDLGSLIGDLDPSAEIYRPQLRYLLVDESKYSREELAALANPVAELFRIEKSRDWREVQESFHRLQETIPPGEDSLRRAFGTWLKKVILPRLGRPPEEVSEVTTLKEGATMLLDSIDRWTRETREEGHQEGLQEGLQKGEARILLRQLRMKFGPLAPEVEERVRSTDAERLLEWSDRVLTAEQLQDVFRD